MAQSDSAASTAADNLRDLPGELAAAYPRAVHRGRLEQIAQHAATLAGLVGELDAEEEREADFADRLLVMHRSGIAPANSHGQERLQHALASQEASE